MNIEMWNNGKSEMFRDVPVICPECEEQVGVTGYLEEGELRVDDCPACGHEFALEVKDGDQEDVAEVSQVPSPHLAKATVMWLWEGVMKPQSSAVIGPTPNILVLLANVLDDGVRYFNPREPEKLHGAVAKLVLENFVPPEARKEIANAILNPPTPSQNTNNDVLNIYDIIDEDGDTEDDKS